MGMVTSNAVYDRITEANEWYTLITKAQVSATPTEQEFILSRKISDYCLILIVIGNGTQNTRETLLIPASQLTASATIYGFCYVGGILKEVDITIVSDTKVSIIGDTSLYLGIYGVIKK